MKSSGSPQVEGQEKRFNSRSSTHHAVSYAVSLIVTSTDFAAGILELKNIIPSTIGASDERKKGKQTNDNQLTEPHNEEHVLEVFQPPIANICSKRPAKSRKTVSEDSQRQLDRFLTRTCR